MLLVMIIAGSVWGQTTYTSTTSGNWSTMTWSPSGTPGSNDNVVIADGHTVTINEEITIVSLTVGQGTSGTLIFDGTSRTVNITGIVNIENGATFITQEVTSATHVMNIGGNVSNNGIFDMSRGGADFLCDVTFNNNGNQTVSGTGSTTRFNAITLDMGTSNTNILEITANNFSAKSAFLTITNGTFKLTSAVEVTAFSGSVTLPVTGGIWVNGGTITTTGASLEVNGKLQIDSGVLNIGSSTGHKLDLNGASAQFIMSEGALNISGYWDQTSSGDANISGGVVNILTAGNVSNTVNVINIPSTCDFVMSGGNFNLKNLNSGSGQSIYISKGGNTSITGGTITVENSDQITGSSKIQIDNELSISSLVINIGNGTTLNNDQNNINVAANLTITSGSLQINSGKFLTVSGTLTNNAGSSGLILKSDDSGTGSLIVNGTVTGNITAERYIAAASDWINANDGWHLLSSPIASQAISGDWTPDGSSSNDYDFYAWDESQQLYLNQKVGVNSINTFDPGVGYFVAYQATATPEFTGAPNTTSQTENLTLSGVPAAQNSYGYNLLGNPFQSAIDWSHVSWDKTDVGAVAKIWNNGAFIDIDDDPSIIPAMNGFFVSTSSNNNSFTIPAEARVHNSQNWYKSVSNNTIKLIAKDVEGHLQQESRIRFNVEATAGFDQAFDGPFMTGYAPLFYSTDETHLYSTNTLPELNDELEIPFGFVKNASSSFEIELAKSIDDVVVYLTDFKSGVQHNLTESGKYSFTATEGDNPDRFLLHFGIVGIEDNTSNLSQINAYAYQNQLYVQSNLNEAQVSLYDIQGHQLLSREIDGAGSSRIPLDLPSGIYIVRLQSNNQVKNVKVFIN